MHIQIETQGWKPLALALLMGVPLSLPSSARAADNLRFSGGLVAEACSFRPGDEAIVLDQLEASSHYLYLNARTVSKPFQIHLEGCDTSISNFVTTRFSGNENPTLPGLLALGGGSTAAGVAIGIETPGDNLVPLNVASDRQLLSNGANVIAFKAFIEAEPQAITNRSITAGNFTATSIFMLNYP
ncbi:fimbrial protein [Pseudomonas sp. MS-1(2024)]|uniref:fimbrial protein n=1 Tax=Pseudomonas sp. MS-1(2024) TaxID=3112251 RepID=UPI002DB9205A|nr:fimbrial protein [Pseudomonas sp. MS-1(2024)]MEC4167164.1 fimbrial protein [Pseudomonas sp. MS-1(2024)]